MSQDFNSNFSPEFNGIEELLTGRIKRLPTSIDSIVDTNEYRMSRLFPNYDKVLEINARKKGDEPIILTQSWARDDYLVLRSEIYNPENPRSIELVETLDRKIERLIDMIAPGDDPEIQRLFDLLEIDIGPKIPEYQIRATRFEPTNPYDEDDIYEDARKALEEEGKIVAVGPV
jgi:hypothetical protein